MDHSTREIPIQHSPFSCFVFSASSHVHVHVPQKDTVSLIRSQDSTALRDRDLHSGLASVPTEQVQDDLGLSFGTSQV